jgi:Trp operon repressor
LNTSQNHEQNVEHLSSKLTYGKEAIEWRRAKVLELSSQGRSPREIADIIHVGIGTVNRDLSYLNKQAQENLKTHIQERLPEQYQKCINGLQQVLKIGWNIVNTDSSGAANRLQALAMVVILTYV